MNIIDYYKMGQELYKMLLDKLNIYFIICPCSMGDTTIVSSHITTYKKIRNIDKVVLVTYSWQEDLINLFPHVDGVFPISDSYMYSLRVYIQQENLFDNNNVLYSHYPSLNDWDFREFDHGFGVAGSIARINFIDEYKGRILKIPLDSVPDKIAIPEYETNIDLSEYENSVLLLPHGRTEHISSDIFWEQLINNLKSSGNINKIYTNAFSPNDNVLEGTEKCSLKISELCYVAKHFKQIIGIRSGMFDVLNLAPFELSLDVIHPHLVFKIFDKCEISSEHPIYFSFDHNPLVKIKNYAYVNGYEKQLANEICENFDQK